MAISYVGKGSFATGTGAITPGLPSGLSDGDLLISVFETANQAITHGSWTEITDSPQGTGTAAAIGAVRVSAFYKIYATGDTAPASSDSGNHQCGIIVAFRGVDTTTPFEDTAGSTSAAANIHNLPAPVVSTAEAMAVYLVAMDRDIATSNTQFRDANWLCAALDGGAATEVVDEFTADGVGGGVGVAYKQVTTPATLSSGTVQLAGTNSFAAALLAVVLTPASAGATTSPDDASHGHSATSPSIDAIASVSPDDATSGHTATEPTLSVGATSVSPNNASHGHSSTSPTIAAKSTVSPNNADHAHSATQPTLAAKAAVAPANAQHGLTSTSPTLLAKFTVTPTDSSHGHSATQPVIAAKSTVSPNAAIQAHSATEPTLTLAGTISPANAFHSLTSTGPTLTTRVTVSPANANQAHSATSPTVAPQGTIVPDTATQGHLATSPTIAPRMTVTPANAAQAHAATSPTITQVVVVTPATASNAHFATSPILAWRGQVTVNNSTHANSATSPIVATALPITPHNTLHAHTASSVSFSFTPPAPNRWSISFTRQASSQEAVRKNTSASKRSARSS